MSKRKLEEIVNFNPSYSLKRGDIAPFIDMASLSVKDRNIYNITQKKFTGGGARFKNGDTLFARITPCLENGKTAKVSGLPENAVGFGSTEFIVLSAKNPLFDEDYIYYLARLPEFRQYAQTHMEGTSGRQRVSWQSLSEFSYPFPDEKIRKRSANILKIFDDKIELNTQTNQTLEQIAQAIFKSWFVDFDPVKAKMDVLANGGTPEQAELQAMQIISGKTADELKQMQHSNPEQYKTLVETTALFPSEMVESELGDIPKGWEVATVGESYHVVMGQSPKGETYNTDEEGTLFYQGRAEFGWRFPTPRLYTTDPKRIAKENDILMSVRAPVGDINVALEDCCIGRGLCSLKHTSGSFSFGFYQIKELKNKLDQFNSEGTVFGSINQKDLKSLLVILPSTSLIQLFEQCCKDIDANIKRMEEENVYLIGIRDSLLPKLLRI